MSSRRCSLWVAGVVVLCSAGGKQVAWAQQGGGQPSAPQVPSQPPAPALPANPTSPLDFQAPAPTRSAEPAAKPATDPQKTPTGYSGGDYVTADTTASYSGGDEAAPSGELPEYHEVAEGDTLWSICSHYYDDPWTWPKLWAHNRAITNPHWIYPGDRVSLIGGKPGVAPQKMVAQRQPGLSVIRFARAPKPAQKELHLRQVGYVDPVDLKQAGRVVGSKTAMKMLSVFDEVYVEGQKFGAEPGKRYTVYQVRRPIEVQGKVMGHLVEIYGTLRVKRLNEHGVATCEITESRNPIERGFRVGPLRRTYKHLSTRPAKVNLEGNVIAVFNETKHFATDDLVFIDRGRTQGVQLGNRFLVVQRGDGYRQVMVDRVQDNPRFPHEVIAEIGVLDLRDQLSVGVVTKAVKELRIGDRLFLRRGY